jgi:putative PIN family toxin of toxin-antitoxin system
LRAAVLDVNVLVSALLSPDGAPAQLLREWHDGAFDLIVSEALLAELERVLAYPKLARYVLANEAEAFIASLTASATMAADPAERTHRTADPDDDYLLALAEAHGALVVSGDGHLTAFADRLPVLSPSQFLALISQ